ncbi:hypothetical protein [Hyphobacterium sp.]|uniref:hypothetical protein n=1 Tax=Hyphobacterium sp. TaxID=2004662 RepID=UPI003BAC25DC
MSVENWENNVAAILLLFDKEAQEEIGALLAEKAKTNGYYGALIQISKYLSDKRSDRLDYAFQFTKNADLSVENRSALYLLILELYKRHEGQLPDTQKLQEMEKLWIDWTKTNPNILYCIEILLPDEFERLKNLRT